MMLEMTADEFRDGLELIGYTQTRFARLVGVNGRTCRRWALDDGDIPGSVAILLRLMLARPEIVPVIEELGHIPTLARVD